MDLSKLPKLSETPRPDVEQSPEPAPLPYAADYHQAGSGGEIWLSIALGLILLFMSPRFLQYVISRSTFPQKWKFNDAQGNPLTYTQTVFFWGDLALMLFAVVLIVEGIVLALGRRRILRPARRTVRWKLPPSSRTSPIWRRRRWPRLRRMYKTR